MGARPVRWEAYRTRRLESALRGESGLAHHGLELPKRRKILRGAPGDKSRAVAVPAKGRRHGLEAPSAEAFEKGEREQGEVGAACQQ